MKKLILILSLVALAFGCKKSDGPSNEYIDIQYNIYSSNTAEKFIDSDKPRFNITGKSYTGTYAIQKGTTMRLSCGYRTALPGETIRISVIKNGITIADQTKEQRVDISMIP